MDKILKDLIETKKNFVFIGEAGSGKSEIAINFALSLVGMTTKTVHFFDMDQTKPLFRSRDVRDLIEDAGVVFHHEEQFYDAPTLVGGLREQLADLNSIVIVDVGGNQQGARLIGGYAPFLNRDNCKSFFVINPYRPWSQDVLSIDGTLSSILKVSHIKEISIISNPNLGRDTTVEEVIKGNERVIDMLSKYISIDYMCAMEELSSELEGKTNIPLIPIKLYLTNLWGS